MRFQKFRVREQPKKDQTRREDPMIDQHNRERRVSLSWAQQRLEELRVGLCNFTPSSTFESFFEVPAKSLSERCISRQHRQGLSHFRRVTGQRHYAVFFISQFALELWHLATDERFL